MPQSSARPPDRSGGAGSLPHGLSSHHALSKLILNLEGALSDHPSSSEGDEVCRALRRALSAVNAQSLFPCTTLAASASICTMLAAAASAADDDAWLWLATCVCALWAVADGLLAWHDEFLRGVELRRRSRHVLNRLRQVKDLVHWNSHHYPHPHTPLSASIVLQWAIRDRRHVNVPWALLVEGDLILMKPGQAAPGRCHAYDNPRLTLEQDEILHIKTHRDEEISPTPEFKAPAIPQLFVMEETPYLRLVRKVLGPQDPKPPSIFHKHAYLFFTQMLIHILLPTFFTFSLLWKLLTQQSTWDASSILLPVLGVSLPLLPLPFPLAWVVINYGSLAWLLGVYSSSRHVKMTADPFDDTVEDPEVRRSNKVPWWKLRGYFRSAALGTGEYLSRTENVVHTLGSVTALCCADKKGILSWPNASPEKIFVVKRVGKGDNDDGKNNDDDDENNDKDDDDGDDDTEGSLVPEILTVTHNRHNPFQVEFDDPQWTKYLSFLKPLGLGILLNTCNISTEEKYTNFFNHLICESIKVEAIGGDGANVAGGGDVRGGDRGASGAIDMLPIVTRGCLCELATKIGFAGNITQQYSLASQIQTFRHVQPNQRDKFARSLSQARLKFPFPHLVSVLVQHRTTGSRQLITQGTADIVLDSCTDCWTGSDLDQLTEDLRKKIMDFYHRASLSSYCTAFAFRPQTFQLPWRNCREYLQLPTHSNPFYWQYTEEPGCLDADTLTSHISIDGKISSASDAEKKADTYVKTKEDAMLCLEMECNQTFLGMIQLQYQAVVEFVQLIDLLEKACIRFVHFSKENELRSRVFSEKMGLESGWNCHISLKSSGGKKTRTVEEGVDGAKAGGRGSGYRGSRHKRQRRMGASLPEKLNRPAWYLDFPKWQEIKGLWGNGDSVGNSAGGAQYNSVMEGAASRHASVTSDSDPFEYDMSNRAQLPKGIENIRPHLETMDNVPLLVSLFTDCTPSNTTEMLKIMQEYGEVVCVIGSSANYRNIDAFLQSDASLAIEPRYPQLCQKVPVFHPCKDGGPSPVAISQLLNSVASSLSFKMVDEISIYHLILESRHFMTALLNAMKFWMCSLFFVSVLQLVCLMLSSQPFLTLCQALSASLVTVPLLSLSLLGTRTDPNVMNVSTGKNHMTVDIRYALWCYGSRFAPAAAILVLCHVLGALDDPNISDTPAFAACNMVFFFLYLSLISLSFIFRRYQLWSRHPFTGHCPAWPCVFAALLAAHVVYMVTLISLDAGVISGMLALPYTVWVLWCVGLFIVPSLNELVKRQEIKVEVRHQKRERLEFGTKLGINSPF